MGNTLYRLIENGDKGFTLNGRELPDDVVATLYAYLSALEFAGVADSTDTSGEPDAIITLESDGKELVYSFYRYRNDYFSVELNGSGTVSGYIKAEHLAVLVSAFDEAYNS
jgi:hypothetical protein